MVTELGDLNQADHQTPNFESVTSYQSPVTSDEQCSVTPNSLEVNNCCVTAKSENEKTELVRSDCSLVTEEEWLMKLLDDLETDASVHNQDDWLELIAIAEEKISAIDDFAGRYPDYWGRIWTCLHQTTPREDRETGGLVLEQGDKEDLGDKGDFSGEQSPVSPPSLNELKSLLLGSKTWVELKQLHKQHPSQAKVAYRALTPSEQQILDAIAATEVNQDVYKYVGQQRKVDGVEIEPGTLVYLDPQSSNKNRLHLKVRLLQGFNQGWQRRCIIARMGSQI